MKVNNKVILSATISGMLLAPAAIAADTLGEALSSGTAYGDFRLRYESVEQDNTADDASALTLRTRLGYTTGSLNGFSSTIEFEDSRVVAGVDNYDVPGFARDSDYIAKDASVIPDQETTELDQFFVQYKSGVTTSKLGRQVITLDDHRFVGHVGWRQDRQTFDAFSFNAKPAETVDLTYAYITKRNRIFGEVADIKSKDHLFNGSYLTSVGKVVAYAYLLEEDNDTSNGIDTLGVSFSGSTGDSMTFLYRAELASQSSQSGSVEYDTTYRLIEGGLKSGKLTAKIGYEVLGSDGGAYGFATPLATLHKFNGWNDQFLNTPIAGLVDTYVSVGYGLPIGSLNIALHDFSADDGGSDYGSEIDIAYGFNFSKDYHAGVKYSVYGADDFGVDTDKLWLWVGTSF